MVTFNVTPGTNAACVAVTESLPPGLAATSVTAGGNYIASNNVVLWGPFFGTNAQTLSYQAVGQPGTYPVRASWSVDGVGGGEAVGTNIVVSFASGGGVPAPPPQVATPTFSPASGSECAGERDNFLRDDRRGRFITRWTARCRRRGSTLYTSAVNLASASTIRAVAFTNGWTPSVAAWHITARQPAPANAQVTRSVNLVFSDRASGDVQRGAGSGRELRGGDGIAASGSGCNECDGGRQLHCQQQRRAVGAVLRNERPGFELCGSGPAGDLSGARDLERGWRGRR